MEGSAGQPKKDEIPQSVFFDRYVSSKEFANVWNASRSFSAVCVHYDLSEKLINNAAAFVRRQGFDLKRFTRWKKSGSSGAKALSTKPGTTDSDYAVNAMQRWSAINNVFIKVFEIRITPGNSGSYGILSLEEAEKIVEILRLGYTRRTAEDI